MNAASCIISQRKTVCVNGVVIEVLLFWGFGFCLRHLRDLREILGGICALHHLLIILFTQMRICVFTHLMFYSFNVLRIYSNAH